MIIQSISRKESTKKNSKRWDIIKGNQHVELVENKNRSGSTTQSTEQNSKIESNNSTPRKLLDANQHKSCADLTQNDNLNATDSEISVEIEDFDNNTDQNSEDNNVTSFQQCTQPEYSKHNDIDGIGSEISLDLENFQSVSERNSDIQLTHTVAIEHASNTKKHKNQGLGQQFFQLMKEIGVLLIGNPIIWSIVAGIIVSVSGLCEFLNPESESFVVQIAWLESALRELGTCLTPIALVVTGLWISQNKIFKSCDACMIILNLFFKFVVIPVSMIPIAMLVGLRGYEAKAAVILSAMPMALVVIPLSQQYNVSVNDFTVNLVLGLVLMFPCILGLMEVMNHFGWFDT